MVTVTRWFAGALPAIAAVLVLTSLGVRGTHRALLLGLAGLLLAQDGWRYLPRCFNPVFDLHVWWDMLRQSGEPMIRQSFRRDVYLDEGSLAVPLLLLLGVLHGASRCRSAPGVRSAVLLLILPFLLFAGFFLVGVCLARTPGSFFDKDAVFVGDPRYANLRPNEWGALGIVILARIATLALVVFGIVAAAGGDRHMMRAGFLAAAILLGCDVAVQTVAGAQIGYFIWTDSAGRWDHLFHGGVLAHRLVPRAVGYVLIAAGLGRLTTAACVGRALKRKTRGLSEPPTSSATEDRERKP